MVKAQKSIGRKALALGMFLSIGFFNGLAKADDLPDFGEDDIINARERAVTNAKENTTAVTRAEEIKQALEQNPGNTTAAQELQQINRGVDERSQQTYGDADRFAEDRQMQQLATNVASTAKDWPHMQAYADRWAALAEPDSLEWAKAVNTGGLAAQKAGNFQKAEAAALRVLDKFPKDKDALSLYHASKGRGRAVASPASAPAAAPAPTFTRAPVQAAPFVPAPAAPNVKSYLDRAATFIGMRDYRGAIDAAQRAAALDPSNPDPHMQQAVAWAALRNVSEAMLAISRAIERLAEGDARLPTAYNTRASYKNKASDYVGAAADASEAIKRDPVMADAYYQRALARKAQGHKAESLADAKKAAELKPSDYQSMYELGLREMAEKGAPVAESALHKTWTWLLGKAGGSFNIIMGAMGALFVLFSGCVLWFAKEGSTVRRFRDSIFLTSSSQAPTVTTPVADVDGAGADGLEGRAVDGGKYRIICMIGQGGMGTVYKAYDLALKRDVAIKCMNEALLPNERECARFVNEGRTVAKLRHPNIVAVHSLFKEGKRALIVFEHIEGDTLHHVLKESLGRRLEPRRALAILAQLAAAVDHAHGEGVIHRDLKPPNVMVYGGDKVKVMDFGISRVVEHMEATQTKTIVGTPIYMAPEQCDGIVVRQSDVYALGIIAYEMLTGILPFRDMGPMQLDKREGRFPAASALLPTLPAAVDSVFKKVLDPDPEKRYPRGRDFIEALDVALRQATPPRA